MKTVGDGLVCVCFDPFFQAFPCGVVGMRCVAVGGCIITKKNPMRFYHPCSLGFLNHTPGVDIHVCIPQFTVHECCFQNWIIIELELFFLFCLFCLFVFYFFFFRFFVFLYFCFVVFFCFFVFLFMFFYFVLCFYVFMFFFLL